MHPQLLPGLSVGNFQMPRPRCSRIASSEIVETAGRQSPAVRTKRHTVHAACMHLELDLFVACPDIPYRHSPIPGATGQTISVRTESHTSAAALLREEFLPGLRIPHDYLAGRLIRFRCDPTA